MSAAYRDLFINTSRERMQYADFPMPTSYPDFPHHTHIARVLRRLRRPLRPARADRLRDRRRARRAPRGRRLGVELDTGETRTYDALLVANGHHWDPRWPEPAFPGAETFAGDAAARALLRGQLDLRRQATSSSSAWATPRWTSPSESSYVAAQHLSGGAPGRVDHPQVRVRQTGRPAAATTRASPSRSASA